MKFKILTIAFLLSLLLYSNAIASWSFDISTDYVMENNQVEFLLTFSSGEEAATLYDYDLGFLFDTEELTYISHQYESLSGISNETYYTTSIEEGIINQFNAGSWGGLFGSGVLVDSNTSVLLGSFLFEVSESTNSDGDTDFDFNYGYASFKVVVDMVDVSENETNFPHNSTDIGSVPVPSAIWLMGAGLMALAGIRRK